MAKILDLGTGIEWQKYLNKDYESDDVTCVDKSLSTPVFPQRNLQIYAQDIFEFLGNYTGIRFDEVRSNRFFEHVNFKDIPELLYLIKCVLKKDGILDFIVPDFSLVFKSFKTWNVGFSEYSPKDFNHMMIDFHTEIFNVPQDPHQSIWTKELAEYYLTLEDFWEVVKIMNGVTLDNRSWYMRVIAKRGL